MVVWLLGALVCVWHAVLYCFLLFVVDIGINTLFTVLQCGDLCVSAGRVCCCGEEG